MHITRRAIIAAAGTGLAFAAAPLRSAWAQGSASPPTASLLFERRAYTLRPGMIDAFWDAQRTWNVQERASALLDNNLSYFSVAGSDQVVHLYRFNSVDHWRASYDHYYRTQAPEYFRTVRPWVLRQQNSLLVAPPVRELTALWTQSQPRLPSNFSSRANLQPRQIVVVEQIADFFPGTLPAFWAASQKIVHGSGEEFLRNLMGVLVTSVGTLHRVHTYCCFLTMADANTHAETQLRDAHWRAFLEAQRDIVSAVETNILVPSPVVQQRSLFERASPR